MKPEGIWAFYTDRAFSLRPRCRKSCRCRDSSSHKGGEYYHSQILYKGGRPDQIEAQERRCQELVTDPSVRSHVPAELLEQLSWSSGGKKTILVLFSGLSDSVRAVAEAHGYEVTNLDWMTG